MRPALYNVRWDLSPTPARNLSSQDRRRDTGLHVIRGRKGRAHKYL